MRVFINSSICFSRRSRSHPASVKVLNALTVESFERKGIMDDGCLLEEFLGGDRDLSKRDFTGVDTGSFDGDCFLGPSCTGWWHRGPDDGWSKVNCSMTVHREDSRQPDSAMMFLISGRDVWFLMSPHESFLCMSGNDCPGREDVA